MLDKILEIINQTSLLNLLATFQKPVFYLQFFLIITGLALSTYLSKMVTNKMIIHFPLLRPNDKTLSLEDLHKIFQHLLTMVFLGLATMIYTQITPDKSWYIFLHIVNKITVWLFIFRVTYVLSEHRTSIKMVFYVLLPLLILNYFKLLEPTCKYLDSLSLEIGKMRISIFMIGKTVLVFLILFKIFSLISNLGQKYIRRLRDLTYSTRELLIKFFEVVISVLFFFIALNILGVDFTAFAVIGGSLSLGLAFGLQKITANFISGIILLFESSLKANDVIELEDGSFGLIKQITARYTLVTTYDGKDILIPNEEFITKKVVNWTLSNTRARGEFLVNISYDSDHELAKKIMLDIAHQHPDLLQVKDYEPECFIVDFAESGVIFKLRFWVRDIDAIGIIAPKSDLMFAILKEFKAHNINIPFPQRDLHIIQHPDEQQPKFIFPPQNIENDNPQN